MNVDLNSHLPFNKNVFHSPWWAGMSYVRLCRVEEKLLFSYFPSCTSWRRTQNHVLCWFYATQESWHTKLKTSVTDSPSTYPRFEKKSFSEVFQFQRISRYSKMKRLHHILWSALQAVSFIWWRTWKYSLWINCRCSYLMNVIRCLTSQVRTHNNQIYNSKANLIILFRHESPSIKDLLQHQKSEASDDVLGHTRWQNERSLQDVHERPIRILYRRWLEIEFTRSLVILREVGRESKDHEIDQSFGWFRIQLSDHIHKQKGICLEIEWNYLEREIPIHCLLQ